MSAGVALAESVRASIHPDIDWALSAYPAAIAEPADAALRLMLAGRAVDPPAGRWLGSRLTGDGFPLELSFCTADARLRFAVEPGGPTPRTRLAAAHQILERLGAPMSGEAIDACVQMQQAAPELHYGAWVGARVSAGGCAFKLYVEVPESGDAGAWRPPFALSDRTATTRMVACSSGSDAIEIYTRVLSLEPRHLPAVLAPAGLEHRAGAIVELLTELYGYSIREHRIPGPSVGISFVGSGSASPRVTLFLFARALWGSDARIRRQFRHLAAVRGWDDDLYARLSAPLASRDSWRTFHTLLGITIDATETALTIGLRPVAP